MNKLYTSYLLPFLVIMLAFNANCGARLKKSTDTYSTQLNIPPRYQWDNNSGYCGEVSLISAGLYYGQYISQYTARQLTGKNIRQNKTQLLLGKNDQIAAANMHLSVEEWDSSSQQSTDQFLQWVKQNVVLGYPVAIGIYTNEYRFYGDTDPDAGDDEYDHIVPVVGIASNHAFTDPNYYGDDVLNFSDNGLWGEASNPPYHFSYSFDYFQNDREGANAQSGPIYSLPNDGPNYGIAIKGIIDLQNETLPVHLLTSVNVETPEIIEGSNTRPVAMPLTLTVVVSNLEINVDYILYCYNDLSKVPNSGFEAHASQASATFPIRITSGSTFTMTQEIQSDEVAVYRAVKKL